MIEGWFSAFLMQPFPMQRRDFLKIAGAAAASSRLGGQEHHSLLAPTGSDNVAKTEFTLEIAPAAPSGTTAPRRGRCSA
jgi:hypothetical protein